jgi:RNA polymerase sigma-70 factor (ECF subfamily)
MPGSVVESDLCVATIELARGWMSDRPDDDQAFIGRLARGERDALEHLYARYGRALYSYAVELTHDRGLAEELVQDTFVAAWRGAASFRGQASLGAWLFGIARRRAHDRLRRAAHPTMELDSALEVPDEDALPEARALASATRVALRDALDALPLHHREPLSLLLAYELSGRDIGAILGIPEGTVKSRLHAARRALRAALAEERTR